MQEKTIIKVAMITTIFGLLLLWLIADEVTPLTLENLEKIKPQESVNLEGTVTKLVHKGSTYFLDVDAIRQEKMSIVVFPSEEVYLKEGNIVAIQGTVQEYKGKKEVIASKIVVKGEIKKEENKTVS